MRPTRTSCEMGSFPGVSAGFAAPSTAALDHLGYDGDLAAKHVYLAGPLDAPTLLDWQSVPLPGPVAWADRVAAIARLHASLPERLAPRRMRFAFLRSYLRSCTGPSPKTADIARRILAAARSR